MPDEYDDIVAAASAAPNKPKRGKSTYDSNQPTDTDWSLERMSELQDWYGTTYPGKKLPVVNMGQGSIHNRLGFDHRESSDVSLNPATPEGAAFGAKLKELNVPFLAFDRAVPGVATGPHYHIGRPSHKAGAKYAVGTQIKRTAAQRDDYADVVNAAEGETSAADDYSDVVEAASRTVSKKRSLAELVTTGAGGGVVAEPRAKTPRVEDIFRTAVDQGRPVPQRKLSGMGELHEADDSKAERIARHQRDVELLNRQNAMLGDQAGPELDVAAEALRRAAEEERTTNPIVVENERLRKQRIANMPATERIANIPASLAQGAASLITSGLTTAATLGNVAAKEAGPLAGLFANERVTDSPLYKVGQMIKEGAELLPGSNPDLAESYLYGKIPSTAGQVIPFAFGGWVTGGSKLATAVLGGAAVGGDVYEEVKAAGGTDDDAVLTALVGAAILGPTELIGMRGLMKAVAGTAAEGSLRAALKASLRAGTRDAFENWAQETGQEYLQGLLTGQGRSGAQLLEAGALGALMGPVTGTATLASSIPDNIALHPAYERWLKTPEEKLNKLDSDMAALEAEQGITPLAESSPEGQINPHGGRELDLIQQYEKPIALFDEYSYDQVVEARKRGLIAKAFEVRPKDLYGQQHPPLIGYAVGRTEAEATEGAIRLKAAAESGNSAEVGRILGYSESDIRVFEENAANLKLDLEFRLWNEPVSQDGERAAGNAQSAYLDRQRMPAQGTPARASLDEAIAASQIPIAPELESGEPRPLSNADIVQPSGDAELDAARTAALDYGVEIVETPDGFTVQKHSGEHIADVKTVAQASAAIRSIVTAQGSPTIDPTQTVQELGAVDAPTPTVPPSGETDIADSADAKYITAEPERRADPRTPETDLQWARGIAESRGGSIDPDGAGYIVRMGDEAVSVRNITEAAETVRDLDAKLSIVGKARDYSKVTEPKPAEIGDRLTHTNAAINNKPIVAKTDDGRAVVANPENKSGVSVVKPRDFGAEADTLRSYLGKLRAEYYALAGREEKPDTGHLARRLGLANVDENVADDYLQRLRAFAQTHNPNKVELVDRARTLYDKGRFGEATELTEKALSGTHDFGTKVFGNLQKAKILARKGETAPELGKPSSSVLAEVGYRTGEASRPAEPEIITKARERLDAYNRAYAAGVRKMGSGGPDTRQLIDQLMVKGYDFYTGTVKPTFEQWAAKLRAEFGASAEPHLKNIWARVQELSADQEYSKLPDLGDIDTQAASAQYSSPVDEEAQALQRIAEVVPKNDSITPEEYVRYFAAVKRVNPEFSDTQAHDWMVAHIPPLEGISREEMLQAVENEESGVQDLGDIDMAHPERGAVDLNAIRKGLQRKPRSLPKTLEKSGRAPGTNLTYDPLPNEPEFNRVVERLRTEGSEALEAWYRSAPESAERTFAHEVLVDHYKARAVAEDSPALQDHGDELSDLEAERATIGGQTTQAYAHLKKYKPAGLSLEIAKAKLRMKAVGKVLTIPTAEREKVEAAAQEYKTADIEIKKKRAVVQKLEVEAGVTEPVGVGVGKGSGSGSGGRGAGRGPGAGGTTVSTTLKPKVKKPTRNYLGDFLAELSPNERVLEGAKRMIGDTDLARWMRETKAKYNLSQEDATRLGQQSHALLKKARKAATAERRLDTLRKRYPDATTPELLEARDQLDTAIKRRREAKQELARFFDRLNQKQQGYWRRSMNITRAMMVSQLSTAMRNAQSQLGALGTVRIEDVVEHVFRKSFGMESDFTIRSIGRNALRVFHTAEKQAREIAGEHPTELARMFNEYFAGVDMPQLEHGPIANKFWNGIETVFSGKYGLERASKLVNYANQLQEFHLRGVEFLSELDLHIRKDHDMPLERFIQRYGVDAIPKKAITESVDKALEVTFAANPGKDGAGGQLLNALINFGGLVPPTVSPVAFPKFMFNSLKFLYQHSPVGMFDLARRGQNRPRVVARALVGSAFLLTALGFRGSDYAGEKWYELKVGGHTLDARPFGPFSTYLFVAEALRRWYKGEKHFTAKEIAEAIGASSGPGGTAIAVADKLYTFFMEGQFDKGFRLLKTEGGDFGRALLTPIRQLKDLIAAFDPEEGYTRDTSAAPFTGPIRESIPFASRGLPVAGRVTTATPIHQERPAIKALTGWRVQTPKTFLEQQLDELHFTFAEIRPSTGIAPIDAFEKRAMGPLMDALSTELEADPEFAKLGPAQRADLLKDHIENIREEVRDMGKAELPEEYERLKEDRKPRRKKELERELENSPGLSKALQLGVPMGIPSMRPDEDDLAYRARLLQLGKARRMALDKVVAAVDFRSAPVTQQRKALHSALV